MKKVSENIAKEVQNATVLYTIQNGNIATAISALKAITHQPLEAIPNETKFINKNNFFGVTEEDRKVISDFVKFLESKEMPMRDLFNHILKQE